MTARFPIIVTALLVLAPLAHAAHLGPARRVGPIGTAPAVALLGAVLPYGDGYVSFTSQPMPNQTSLYKIVATPIDHNGIVQYDKARTLVTGVSSAPLAAATDSGYVLCWTVQNYVFTVALSPSLDPHANYVSSLGQVTAGRLACSGSSCLLTIVSDTQGSTSLVVLDANGVPKNQRPLLRPGYSYQSALGPAKSGFAFYHGETSPATYPSGVTWLDTDGNVTAETPLTTEYPPGIAPHPSGALLVSPSTTFGTVVRAWILSPDGGILKTASFSQPQGEQILGATVAGNGTNYLLAVSETSVTVWYDGNRPSGIGGFLLTPDLNLVHPWFEIAKEDSESTGWRFEYAPSVSSNGGDFVVAWKSQLTSAHETAVASTGTVSGSDGMAIALAPASQYGMTLAASSDCTLATWYDVNAEPATVKWTHVDRAGIAPDTTTLTARSIAVPEPQAIWNGHSFAVFGSQLNGTAVDLTGGHLGANGELHENIIARDRSLLNVWWDGAAYVVVAQTSVFFHLLRIRPDLTVYSDVLLPPKTWVAAGVPGRTMIMSYEGDPVLKILDEQGAGVATKSFSAPVNNTNFQIASNGRDQFMLVVTVPVGTIYASRFTPDGKQLDDLTTPVMKSFNPVRVEAFGDRWLLVTSDAAIEFPSRKPVDLTAAGTIVAMAPASFDRIVLMTSETVTIDRVPLQLLMLRDLIDDGPPRKRASH